MESELTQPSFLENFWDLYSALMTVITTIFLIYWTWKHREEIKKKKDRIESFALLGIMGMVGASMAGMFGYAFVGLTYNTLVGNITGMELVPEIFHIPIIVGIIGLCGLLSWAGLKIMYRVVQGIKKAISDPTFKI